MPKFRKKPVEVEAAKFDGIESVDETPQPMFDGSFDVLPNWLEDAMLMRPSQIGSVRPLESVLEIHTLEGIMIARPGDYIIRGVTGELYPCKPDIFAATYEPA